ncbi:MAG: cysteine desulfurase-like protein [Ilumatobacteraceae bacterium]
MALDLDIIRPQFPALALRHGEGTHADRPRTYLDNPAGTQLPERVLDAMRTSMVEFNANMGGNFRTSRESTAMVQRAHEAVADMFHAGSWREIVFGPNMTTLTFMMARALGPQFQEGDELILTHMEHDGNNTTWRTMAEERGMVVKTLPFSHDTYEFDLDELAALITPRTRMAAINHASNILGTINPVQQMCALLREHGVLTYVDSVQYAPHGPIDVQAIGSDFLVASTYKFYGPHQGVLWGRPEHMERLRSYKLSVVPDITPNRWETGCQSHEGQAGVLAAVEYLAWVGDEMGAAFRPTDPTMNDRTRSVHAGLAAMADSEHALSLRLIGGLTSIPGVRVHGITDPSAVERRVPTVSFSKDGLDPADMARHLDAHGVYVWNGHSYALPVIRHLGLEDKGGVVRVGPTHYNTLDEVDTALDLISGFLGA